MSAEATTREEALERKVAHLDGKREDALDALESVIETCREEGGAGHTSAAEQAYDDVAAELEPIAETLRRFA